MPQYTIEDSKTGRSLTVEGDAPPSQQDADELFASLPKESKDSIARAAATGAVSSLPEAAGAWAGIEAMESLTAPAVVATAEVPPLSGAIAIGSGLIGAIGGSTAASYIKDKILPESVKQKIAKAHADNRAAFDVGSVGANLAAFRLQPGKTIEGVADMVGGRFGTKAAKTAAAQIGLGAGISVASPLVQGQKPDAEGIIMGVIQASLLGESRGGDARVGTLRMEAAQKKAAEIYKSLNPEEKAHILSVAQTGLEPRDHQIIQEATAGKKVRVLTPDEEAAVLGKTTAKTIDTSAQDEVNRIFTGPEVEDKPPVQEELSEEEQLAKEIDDADKIKGEHLREMADAGLTRSQIAKVKSVTEMRKVIEARKAQKEVEDAITKTEAAKPKPSEESKPSAAKPSEPEPAPANEDVLDKIYGQLDEANSPEDIFNIVDGPEAAGLPEAQKSMVQMRGRERKESLEAEQAVQAKVDEAEGYDPNNAPFSKTRAEEQNRDDIQEAAAKGAIAQWDQRSGQVILFPRNLSKKMQFMRAQGFSENYIKHTVKSVIAHEEIHGATPPELAADYWNGLSRFERWAHEQIYPSGTLRSHDAAYMGMEAIRMRMQDILRMTPDEIAELSGTFRLKLDAIYSMQKAVRTVRENLIDRGARGRSVAILKEIEIKLNFAEVMARTRTAGVRQNAETRADAYEKVAEEQENAAKEFAQAGDKDSADELMERAKWIRQKGSEQAFPFSESRAPKFIGRAPEFTKKDGTKVGGFRMFNIHDPIIDRNTGEVLHSPNSTVSENTLVRHGIPIPGDVNSETRAQDRFGFDDSFEPKPLTPEQQLEARRIAMLSRSLEKLQSKENKTADDHRRIRTLEEQLGQGMMPFAETRGGEFQFEDPRKPIEVTPASTVGKLKQPDLIRGQSIGTRRLTRKESEQASEIQQRAMEVAILAEQGDFTTESVLPPDPSAFEFEARVDKVAGDIIDRRLKAIATGRKPRPLEDSVKELIRAFSMEAGVPQGHVQVLAAQAFWKRLNTLKGSEIDDLLNWESKRTAKEKGIQYKGTSDVLPEDAIEKAEEKPKPMTDVQFRAAWSKLSDEDKQDIIGTAQIEAAKEKETFVEGMTHEPPAATVRKQDVDFIRSALDVRRKRLSRLFMDIIDPLLHQTEYTRNEVSPEDIRYGGVTNKQTGKWTDAIVTFHTSDQKNLNRLTNELLAGWFRNKRDPKTASQRLAVLQSKTSGEVYMVSVYKRGNDAYIVDPLSPNREHAPLEHVLGRYDIRHSILIDEPIKSFKKGFSSYKEFNDTFFREVQERDRKARSYFPEPLSTEEAFNAMPYGTRIGGKITDGQGHSADVNDPMAEEKVVGERKSTLENLKKYRDELEERRDRGEPVSDSRLRALDKRIGELETPAKLRKEYSSPESGVTKGEGSYVMGPSAGRIRGVLGLGRSGVRTSTPLTENETGVLYDFLNEELPPQKLQSAQDVEAILMGSKFTKNAALVNAIGKYGRKTFKDFWESARSYIREQRLAGKEAPPIDPKLEGYKLIKETARRLYKAMRSSPTREDFIRNIRRAVNGPEKVEVKPEGEVSTTARELTYGPRVQPMKGYERAKFEATHGTLPKGKLTFSTQRKPLSFPTDRPSPPVTEAVAAPMPETFLHPDDQKWLSEFINAKPQDPELPVHVPISEMMEFSRFHNSLWDEMTKNPKQTVQYFESWQERALAALEASRMEGEGGISQMSMTRALEPYEHARTAIRAWQSGRGNKDTLARGWDGASTLGANQALKAAKSVLLKTTDKAKLAALKAFISAKSVQRTYIYSPEAIERAKEIVGNSDEFKLSRAMLDQNVAQTKILLGKLKADRARNEWLSKESRYIHDLENQLNQNLISTDRLMTIGREYQEGLRRGVERQLVDEGLLNHRGVQYRFDPSQVHKIDGFKSQVESGTAKARKLQSSPDYTDRKAGKIWEDYNAKLMQELNFARDNFKDPELQAATIAYIKEMDAQFDLEKEHGYEVRFDDATIPGRYDAELFNNDSVTFGERRILGRRYALKKTFENYYEAAGTGPYIAMTLDTSALLEHRVRAGLTKVNIKAWEDSWKTMKDEHADAPVAVDVKKVGQREVPDPPKGVEGSRYEMVERADGSKMAVLYGYHRLYRQLTEPSAVMDWAPSRVALQAFQFLKHSLLMGDFFHLARVGYYSAAINGFRGLSGGMEKPGWAALEFRESQLDEAVQKGMIRPDQAEWCRERIHFNQKGNKGAISRIELAQELQKNGLNVGQIMDALYRDLATAMPILGPLNKVYNRFLFDKWTRGLMSLSAINEFERIQTANPQLDSQHVLKTVARDMNNFFGSIGTQGWIKSRTWQDISRMVLLAPQWFEGLVKKDFSIPYKLSTGGTSGAAKLLKGQESMARGMVRGMLFMAAMTQVVNLINKGKPTWENDDKEHKFDADMGHGVFISPLAVYNEILHDIIRYSEVKPKVWDAISQVGENKMGFYTRAALIAATDKSPTGEYQTTSAGVLKEIGKSMVPLPITVRGPARLIKNWVSSGTRNTQDEKAVWAIAGIKAEVERSAASRMQSSADRFVNENHLKADTVIMTPTDEPSYQKLRRAIEMNDAKGAESIYQDLKKTRTEPKIAQAMRGWENKPFTGSRKNEILWLHSMDDADRAAYEQAVLYKRGLYNKWVEFFISHRA